MTILTPIYRLIVKLGPYTLALGVGRQSVPQYTSAAMVVNVSRFTFAR